MPVKHWLFFLFYSCLVLHPAAGAENNPTLNLFMATGYEEDVKAWRAGANSPAARPVAGNPAGILFSCSFNQETARCYWDHELRWNLEQFDLLELELACTRADVIDKLGVYLKCGGGWRLWLVPLKENGRQKIRLQLNSAATEGKPAGWSNVSALRLSATRGSGSTANLTLHAVRARTCPFVILRARQSVPNPDEGNAARNAARRCASWLEDSGLPYTVLDDADLTATALKAAKVVLLPYNPTPSQRELKILEAFVKCGGKLIVCYSSEPRLAALMGLKLGDYQAAPRPRQWSSFAFLAGAPVHVPAAIFQESGNIRPAWPNSADAAVIAVWRDAQDKNLKDPAWTRSKHGFWMSHILMDGDEANKKQLLLALLGSLEASAWREAAEHAWYQAGKIADFQDMPAALAAIRRQSCGRATEEFLRQAQALDQQLRRQEAARQYVALTETARQLQTCLTRAYAAAQKPLNPEFRGVWNHSGTGLYPGDWDATCKILADSGVTAVFPNLAWAGLAHYNSRYLATSAVTRTYGDQLKQSTSAAHKYGLELHPWLVCWNLGPAPAGVINELRAAGRLQQTYDGKTLPWLCPAQSDNIILQQNIISEILEQPGVDGIHLDYIRYPGSQACYCQVCRREFEKWHGATVRGWPQTVAAGQLKDKYNNWRAERITAFLRQMRVRMRRQWPRARLSAAVLGAYPACRVSMGQDWGAWLKEDLVDFVCPMDYDESAAAFGLMVQRQMGLPGARGHLYPGIGVTAVESRLAPDQVILQILKTRAAGTGGFMLFDLNRSLANNVLPCLRPLAGRDLTP